MKNNFKPIGFILLFSLIFNTLYLKGNEPSLADNCIVPEWRFWGESIGCAWMASNGNIANRLPDGKTCCAMRTHSQYYFGIKFSEWQSCDPIPCPENK